MLRRCRNSCFEIVAVAQILAALLVLIPVWTVVDAAAENKDQPTLKELLEKPPAEAPADAPSDKAGEEPPVAKARPTSSGPVDELDRGVPRSSVLGFLDATRDQDYERAARYLDARRLPKGFKQSDVPELARQLKIVLDRALWIDLDALSDDPKGYLDDGLPKYRDHVGYIEIDGRKVNILLQHVPRRDGVLIWKFASATVREIPGLHEEYGYGPVGEWLSSNLPEFVLLGLHTWQWVFLVGLTVIAYVVVFIPTLVLDSALRRHPSELSQQIGRFIAGPLRLLIILLLLREWVDLIQPSVTARAVMRASTLLLISFAWMGMRIIDLFVVLWSQRLIRAGRKHVVVLLHPSATTLKVALIAITLVAWLDNIGFEVTTLLAGLGIGGLAVALASQKSIENLIGAVTLYTAMPVRVGDFCRFGGEVGTVEEIGLRATRIRTLSKTHIIVPNAEFASMELENFAGRERYRFNTKLHLRYGTSSDQLRFILIELKKLLYAHPRVQTPPAIVRFVGFDEYSLNIKVTTSIITSKYSEFLAIAEDLNLRTMDIVKSAGTDFAVPTRLQIDSGREEVNTEAAQAAEKQVQEWLENNELYVAEFPEDKIEELKDTLPYPPEGAPEPAS